MEVIPLQSGSSGNCVYVETEGVRLLFDAGISARQAELRLAQNGKDIRDVDALIISHDHRDHTAGIGVFHRKFGLPVHITRPTMQAVCRRIKVGAIEQICHFHAGETLRFGAVLVETHPTPHDAADGVVFVVEDPRHRLGLLTDLGHDFDGLSEIVGSLDAVLLESNYDAAMLATGMYPEFLKNRIRGPHGHLSNDEAAGLLQRAGSRRLQWACLAHLSENNNDPQVALAAHRRLLGEALVLSCADRRTVSQTLYVSAAGTVADLARQHG